MAFAPGHAHLPTIKILHLDNFLVSRQFVPPLLALLARGRRDTAPRPFSNFINLEKNSSIYQTCTAIAPARNKNCTMPTFAKASAGEDGKKHAIPVLPP